HGRVDRVGHDFGHCRAAIDLLEVSGRNLAGTEALDAGLALELCKLGIEARREVSGRNGDAELALQAFVQGLSYLHWGLSRNWFITFGRGRYGAGERTRTSTPCGAGT